MIRLLFMEISEGSITAIWPSVVLAAGYDIDENNMKDVAGGADDKVSICTE